MEEDLDVIASAADRQMSHLKTFAGGQYGEASQNLLNEVAQARLCLLNPHKKKKYDQQQRERLSGGESNPQEMLPETQQVAPATIPTPHSNYSAAQTEPPTLQPVSLRTEVTSTKRDIAVRKRNRALVSWLMLGVFLVFLGVVVVELKERYGITPSVVEFSVKNHARESGAVDGVFLISLDRPRSTDTDIPYRIGGTANLGTDFEMANGFDRTSLVGTVTIPAGQVSTTIKVEVIDDKLNEGNETVSVMLVPPSGDSEKITVTSKSRKTTLTIYDNDEAQAAIKALQDGNEAGPVEGSFLIEQSQLSSADTIVRYDYELTGKELATPGDDFDPMGYTVKIPVGMTSATIPVRVIDDQLVEGPERVVVKLRKVSSGHAMISINRNANRAELLILDNDTPTVEVVYPLELQLIDDDPRVIKDGSKYFSIEHPLGRALLSRTDEELTEALSELHDTSVVKAVYQRFLDELNNQTDEEVRSRPLLEDWYLNIWLAAKEENKELRDQLEQSLNEAARLVKINSFLKALKEFSKAKRILPDNLETDFTLGLIYALIVHNPADQNEHLSLASKSFTKCINTLERRQNLSSTEQANLQAALNNLAILQVAEGRFSGALSSWTKATGWGEVSFELFHNIQLITNYVKKSPKVDSKRVVSRSFKLLQTATEKGPFLALAGVKGWMFMLYLRAPSPDASIEINGAPIPLAEVSRLRKFKSGYGFAVKSGYLLTHRQIVKGAQAVLVVSAGEEGKDLVGYPVASSAADNLVLLKVDGLVAEPLSLSASLPQEKADLTISGCRNQAPQANAAGIMEGIFQAHSDAEAWPRTNLLLAAIPGGEALVGMPLLEKKSGHVVGLVGPSEAFKAGYLPAVTSPALLRFLGEEAGLGVPPAREWEKMEDLLQQAAKSTFRIVALRRPTEAYWKDRKLKKPPVTIPAGWNGLEYRWCWNCYGFRNVSSGKCPICKGTGFDPAF